MPRKKAEKKTEKTPAKWTKTKSRTKRKRVLENQEITDSDGTIWLQLAASQDGPTPIPVSKTHLLALAQRGMFDHEIRQALGLHSEKWYRLFQDFPNLQADLLAARSQGIAKVVDSLQATATSGNVRAQQLWLEYHSQRKNTVAIQGGDKPVQIENLTSMSEDEQDDLLQRLRAKLAGLEPDSE